MAQILKGDGKAFLQVFIGAIIALVLIATIANTTVGDTSTISFVNATVTLPATVNTTVSLTGRDLVTMTITNTSHGTVNSTAFNTTDQFVNGIKTVAIQLTDTVDGNLYLGLQVNATYTANPDGYLSNAGARSISLVTIIIAALAILIFVIAVFYKYGSFGDMIRKG